MYFQIDQLLSGNNGIVGALVLAYPSCVQGGDSSFSVLGALQRLYG